MGGWQNDSDSFTTVLSEKLARRGAKARFDCGKKTPIDPGTKIRGAYKPIWLSEKEKENPMTVIWEFFDDVKLIEARIHLNNLLEVALTTNNTIYNDASEQDALLCFIKQLEKALEVIYRLNFL